LEGVGRAIGTPVVGAEAGVHGAVTVPNIAAN
jgi:hypothetical protein